MRKATRATEVSLFSTLCSCAVVLLLASLLVLGIPSSAAAETSALTVTLDRMLSPTTDSAVVSVAGEAVATLDPGATIEVRVAGPAPLSRLTQPSPSLPVVGTLSAAADSLPEAAWRSASELRLPLPATTLPRTAGAYRVTVEIRSAGALVAAGGTWMGRVNARAGSLDVAFVWRAELGIHKDTQGRFFDTVVQDACGPNGTLSGLAGLATRFPGWRFTVGIEPVLLSQLRDLDGGYTQTDGSETGVSVSGDHQTAKDAGAVLSSLVQTAKADNVEISMAPYAAPDLGILDMQGWRDGFAQVQLGKQEVAQTLMMAGPPASAFSPGLDLSSNAVSDYGRATIERVLVDARVAQSLSEIPVAGTVTARVHDEANDRVTLVLADTDLRALMAPPWDASLLFAGLAALLAAKDRDALVLTTQQDYLLPPQAYLDAIGEELTGQSWIRTQTMNDLVESHPPAARPLLLTRESVLPTDPAWLGIFPAIQSAHAAVADLAVGADPASLTLESARLSLYLSESRWWVREGVSPQEARAGLDYAVGAEATAEDALSGVGLSDIKRSLVWGSDGEVVLSARNDTDSAMTVEVRLSGAGLDFPEGSLLTVKIKPGGDRIPVPLVRTSDAQELSVRMAVGSTVVGEQQVSLRFVTVSDILPWVVLAVCALVVGTVVFLLARSGKKRPAGRHRRSA